MEKTLKIDFHNIFQYFCYISRIVIKEPPFVVKESGYAGFEVPIDIYFKVQGRDDPKKFSFVYDLNLQLHMPNHKLEKREFIFSNPSPELRRKVLDSGGTPLGSIGQMDDRSRDGIDDARSQLISKPKLSGSDGKKHKSRPAPSDDGPKPSSTFANLFGTPIQRTSTSKVSPDQKSSNSSSGNSNNTSGSNTKISGNSSSSKQSSQKSSDKLSSKDKSDKSSKEKKDKNKYESGGGGGGGGSKESSKKTSSSGAFDEKRGREEKRSKERDRSKEKSQKRPPSPKARSRSPIRNSTVRPTDGAATQKHSGNDDKSSGNVKKSKKEKKEKDRDRSGDKREAKHREERPSSKMSDRLDGKREGGSSTPKENAKEKSSSKSLAFDAKPIDSPYDQQASESKYAPAVSSTTGDKKTDKSDSDRKHKHKKKDKHKEKDRGSSKERKKDKEKSSKQQKELNIDNNSLSATTSAKSANSHGHPTPPPTQPKKQPLGAMMNEVHTDSSEESDAGSVSPPSIIQPITKAGSSSSKLDAMDDNAAMEHPSNAHTMSDIAAPKVGLSFSSHSSSRSPAGRPTSEINGTNATKQTDKANKRAAREAKTNDKPDKKRKRKDKDDLSHSGDDISKRMSTSSPRNGPPPQKMHKKDDSSPSLTHHSDKNGDDNMSSSSSPPNTGSTPLSSSGEPYRSPNSFVSLDYITELKALQHKIMALEDNNELQHVVEMIAATGCYEITSKTFDFDLCALDRMTVQRLQDFFAPGAQPVL